MKTSVKESFNRELCLRALAVRLNIILSDVNEYLQCMTFKNTYKARPRPNNDAIKQLRPIKDFSGKYPDPFLQHILDVRSVLINCHEEITCLIVDLEGIDEATDAEVYTFSLRFQEYNLRYKRSKSDDDLLVHFERALASYIHVIYRYTCMLSLKNYIVPPGFERQFLHGGRDYLWLLDSKDDQVAAQIEYMKKLEIYYTKIRKAIGDKNTLRTFTFPSYRKLLKKH